MDRMLNEMRDDAFNAGLDYSKKLEKDIARKWWAIGQSDITEDFEATWERVDYEERNGIKHAK